jgi:hypothetical protein
MAGETDLDAILRSLAVRRRPGTFVFVTRSAPDERLGRVAHAVVREDEALTYVVDRDDLTADTEGPRPAMAWLIVDVHTSLEGVGLTARLSGALARAGIACNVLAGAFHDHLLVPTARAAEAEQVLAALRRPS